MMSKTKANRPASAIRVFVQETTASTTIEPSQSCESHPSPTQYAMKSVVLDPKITTPVSIYDSKYCGIYKTTKITSKAMRARIARICTSSSVLQAIYKLRSNPKSKGSNKTEDKTLPQNKSNNIRLIGLFLAICGLVFSSNRTIAVILLGIGIVMLILAMVLEFRGFIK